MEKLNKTTDIKSYLQSGNLTKPFLDTEFLKKELEKISKKREEQNLDSDIEQCLLEFVHQNLTLCEDKDFVINNQFSRSAQEIFESKFATGCTDFAYVFASLARQMGIPTTILQTAQKEWTNKLINNIGNTKRHYGHTFCECFLKDKWVLVDPTRSLIDWEYADFLTFKLEIEWKVGESRTFLPYFRGADLGKRMALNEFLAKENKIVKEQFSKIYDTTLVKQRFEKINTPEGLKIFMDEILSYGWIDKEKNIHTATMKDIESFMSMTIDEIFDLKIESCFEGAKFAKHWFDKQNIKTKIYFSRGVLENNETGAKNYPSMHFLLLFQCKDGKWGRFEQTNTEEQGVYYFDNFDEAFSHVLENHKKREKMQIKKYGAEKNLTLSSGLFEFNELKDNLTFDELQKITDEKENLYKKETNNIVNESQILSQ